MTCYDYAKSRLLPGWPENWDGLVACLYKSGNTEKVGTNTGVPDETNFSTLEGGVMNNIKILENNISMFADMKMKSLHKR